MRRLKEYLKNTSAQAKVLLVLGCLYCGVLVMFNDAGAASELVGYQPSISIQIKDGGEDPVTYLVKRNTVENVLNDLNIELQKEDQVDVDLKTKVSEGSSFAITRVTYEEVKEETPIAYGTDYVDSDDTSFFGTRLKTAGVEGIKETTYRVKKVNGQEVERQELGNQVIKEPVNEIMENSGVSTGVRFTGKLTRYGADCYGCGTRTAAGLYVTVNGVKNENKATLTYQGGEYYVLAADSSIPFGTIVKVSNHGFSIPDPFYGIVLDRGGAVTGTTMDVFCGSGSNPMFSGGTSYSTVYEIISMGSGATGIY